MISFHLSPACSHAGGGKDASEISTMVRTHYVYCILTVLCMTMQSCSLIYDDLKNCGHDYKIVYKMRLKVQLSTDLQEQLNAEADKPVREALQSKMNSIFTNHAKDIDITFYNADPNKQTYRNHFFVNDSTTELTLYMRVDNYTNLAVANIDDNNMVAHVDTAQVTTRLMQMVADTVSPHNTGIFTSRLPLSVQDTAGNQSFESVLYMANSAVALLIENSNVETAGVSAYVTGMADGLMIADSIYLFDNNIPVRMENVQLTASSANPIARKSGKASLTPQKLLFSTVCFPSSDIATSDNGIWQVVAHVKMPDDKIVETFLSINTPLEAGRLRVIRTQMQTDGTLVPIGATDVGATVDFDWTPGGEYNPEI